MLASTVQKFGALVIILAASALGGTASAQDAEVGQAEFRDHCAACHGLTGLGDGPIGALFKTPPANLAQISQRNGGKFPFKRVYEIIDGTAVLAAHGSRDMPLWGDRFLRDAKPITPDQVEITRQMVQQRILSLVYYIGTLQ